MGRSFDRHVSWSQVWVGSRRNRCIRTCPDSVAWAGPRFGNSTTPFDNQRSRRPVFNRSIVFGRHAWGYRGNYLWHVIRWIRPGAFRINPAHLPLVVIDELDRLGLQVIEASGFREGRHIVMNILFCTRGHYHQSFLSFNRITEGNHCLTFGNIEAGELDGLRVVDHRGQPWMDVCRASCIRWNGYVQSFA